MKDKKYVIVNGKRFFAFITFIFLIFSFILTLVFNVSKAHGSIYSQEYKIYHVVTGDSLWDISLKYMPEGYDVRKMIYEIKKINDMDTSEIFHGDIIKIPVYDNLK
jgi:hypothetical protein